MFTHNSFRIFANYDTLSRASSGIYGLLVGTILLLMIFNEVSVEREL